jgi:hypothetical protein
VVKNFNSGLLQFPVCELLANQLLVSDSFLPKWLPFLVGGGWLASIFRLPIELDVLLLEARFLTALPRLLLELNFVLLEGRLPAVLPLPVEISQLLSKSYNRHHKGEQVAALTRPLLYLD